MLHHSADDKPPCEETGSSTETLLPGAICIPAVVLFLPSGKVGVGDAYFAPNGFYFICYRTVTYEQDKDADARIAFNFGLVGALMAKSEKGEYQASVYRDALKLTCGARASLGFWSAIGPKKSPVYDAMGGIAGNLWGMPVAARQKLFPESLFIPRAEIVSIDVQVGDGSQKFVMKTQGGGYLAWNDLRGGAEKKFLLEPTQGYLRGESVVYPESDPDGLQVGLTTGINQLLLDMSQDRPPTSDADIARLTSSEKYSRRLWREFDSQFSMRTREAILLHSRRSCVGLYRCLCEQLTRELKENTSTKSSKWQLPGCLSIVLVAVAGLVAVIREIVNTVAPDGNIRGPTPLLLIPTGGLALGSLVAFLFMVDLELKRRRLQRLSRFCGRLESAG
jgi:hypothetical protein